MYVDITLELMKLYLATQSNVSANIICILFQSIIIVFEGVTQKTHVM